MAIDERLAKELKQAAPEGKLPCAAALEVAQRLTVPPLDVGEAANELGIKIVECQLGCFGRGKT